MKENYRLILFFFFAFGVAFSQERSSLKGKVANSMGAVVNGSVVNLSSKTRTAISEQGYFEILAQPKDTLLFASLACMPKKVILSSKNFELPFLEIELELGQFNCYKCRLKKWCMRIKRIKLMMY